MFFGSIGMSQRVTQGDVVVQIPGYSTVSNDIQGRPNDNRADSTGFQGSSCQTDSLMTNGSAGNQERSFHSISLQP